MPGMVVLLINDERVTLKNGSPTTQGVNYYVRYEFAALKIDGGEKKTVFMGGAVSTQFSQRDIISEQVIAENMVCLEFTVVEMAKY